MVEYYLIVVLLVAWAALTWIEVARREREARTRAAKGRHPSSYTPRQSGGSILRGRPRKSSAG